MTSSNNIQHSSPGGFYRRHRRVFRHQLKICGIVLFAIVSLLLLGYSILLTSFEQGLVPRSEFYVDEPEWAAVSTNANISDSKARAATGYYRTLPEEQQKLYEELECAMRNHDLFVPIRPGLLTYQEFTEVFVAVLYDNPDIFWVDSNYTYLPVPPDGIAGIIIHYNFPQEDSYNLHKRYMSEVAQTVEGMHSAVARQKAEALHSQEEFVVNRAGEEHQWVLPVFVLENLVYVTETDYLKWIYNEIIESLSYGYNTHDQNVVSYFGDYDDCQTVCAGYAKTYKLLCDAAGLECYVIRGYLYGSENAAHAWDLVQLSSPDEFGYDIYFVEPTWGDRPRSDGGYSSIWCTSNSRFFKNSHIPDEHCSKLEIIEAGKAQTEKQDEEAAKLIPVPPEEATTNNLWALLLEDVLRSAENSERLSPEQWKETFDQREEDLTDFFTN